LIEFRWNRVDKRNNNTPIISDAEIDELAEIILGDYKPQLLQEPRKYYPGQTPNVYNSL
jgi:hypothetical protein